MFSDFWRRRRPLRLAQPRSWRVFRYFFLPLVVYSLYFVPSITLSESARIAGGANCCAFEFQPLSFLLPQFVPGLRFIPAHVFTFHNIDGTTLDFGLRFASGVSYFLLSCLLSCLLSLLDTKCGLLFFSMSLPR